jgi:hypothetical protein
MRSKTLDVADLSP